LYGSFWCQVVSLPVSPGRSRAAGRSPGTPRDRARQLPGACRPILILRGCPVSCRARRGIRPAERLALLPPPPNVWAVAADAAPAPWAVGRSADGAWRGIAPAAGQQSAAPRGCDVWEYRPPIVNRDCHDSLWLGQAGGFCFQSMTSRRLVSDSPRGVRHQGANIAPQTCIRWALCEPNHDAVIRIGGEAPGRRAHSKSRRAGHVQYRVAATSDRHLQSVINSLADCRNSIVLARRHAITQPREGPGLPAPRRWSPVAKA
jgi:hypothetical protein